MRVRVRGRGRARVRIGVRVRVRLGLWVGLGLRVRGVGLGLRVRVWGLRPTVEGTCGDMVARPHRAVAAIAMLVEGPLQLQLRLSPGLG